MATTLIISRHAKPADPHEYNRDGIRPLVEEGRQKQRQLAVLLKEKGIKPDIILASPLIRAKQSAEILAEAFGIDWEEFNALGTNFDIAAVLKKMSRLEKDKTIILVGHIPTLEDLSRLLAGHDCLPLGLAKSGAVHLEFQDKIEPGKALFVDYYTVS